MFKFLFGRRGEDAAKPETQREAITRALADVNAVIATLDPKPAVTIDPATGMISLALPDQMADEALALPKPEEETPELTDSKAMDEAERVESAKA